MITPQLTEQYGQVERVSVVRAILSSFAWACAGFKSKPSPEGTMAPVPVLMNILRVGSMHKPPDRLNSGKGYQDRFPAISELCQSLCSSGLGKPSASGSLPPCRHWKSF